MQNMQQKIQLIQMLPFKNNFISELRGFVRLDADADELSG